MPWKLEHVAQFPVIIYSSVKIICHLIVVISQAEFVFTLPLLSSIPYIHHPVHLINPTNTHVSLSFVVADTVTMVHVVTQALTINLRACSYPALILFISLCLNSQCAHCLSVSWKPKRKLTKALPVYNREIPPGIDDMMNHDNINSDFFSYSYLTFCWLLDTVRLLELRLILLNISSMWRCV